METAKCWQEEVTKNGQGKGGSGDIVGDQLMSSLRRENRGKVAETIVRSDWYR